MLMLMQSYLVFMNVLHYEGTIFVKCCPIFFSFKQNNFRVNVNLKYFAFYFILLFLHFLHYIFSPCKCSPAHEECCS